MKKPMLKWFIMGLLCAMFSVAQVSADEASMAAALTQAQQAIADNPEMSGEDLVNALIDAGVDPADAAAAAVELKPDEAASIKAAAKAAPGADAAAIDAAVGNVLKNKGPGIGPGPGPGPGPITPITPPGAGGGGGASPSK
jgi:hypothetical protein